MHGPNLISFGENVYLKWPPSSFGNFTSSRAFLLLLLLRTGQLTREESNPRSLLGYSMGAIYRHRIEMWTQEEEEEENER